MQILTQKSIRIWKRKEYRFVLFTSRASPAEWGASPAEWGWSSRFYFSKGEEYLIGYKLDTDSNKISRTPLYEPYR